RLWCPLPASLAGRAGARPDHPITSHLGVQRQDGTEPILGSAGLFNFHAGTDAIKVRPMILRRSVILALGSMPLLTGPAFSQTAVKTHRVGRSPTVAKLLSGLPLGFPSAATLSDVP